MKALLAYLLVAVVLLSGCTPTPDPTPPPAPTQENPTVKTEFTKAELLEDYDGLWEDLYANYPYFPVLERKGIDVESIRTQTRETVESRVTDAVGLYHVIDSMLLRMGYFGHLTPISPEVYQTYLYLAEHEEGREQWNDLVLAPQTVATYEQLMGGEPSAAKEGAQGTRESAPLPAVKTDYLPEVKAAYFHFPSFDTQMLNRDADVVADYLATLSDLEVEHIIFDVTGNGGGDDRYWRNNIVSPFGGAYAHDKYVFFGDTMVNRHFYDIERLKTHLQPLSEFPAERPLPDILDEMGITLFGTGTLILPEEGYSGKTVESGAKRWVLVDGFVYSAAESFSIFCKNTGWATLVGKQTNGDGDGFSPVLLALENTGLLVQFSSTVSVNNDGTLNAEYGTTPDIPCIKRETPLEACLRQIRR